MSSGNLGEWSEVYAFLKLLITGEIDEVNSSLQLTNRKIRMTRLLRDDSSGLREFITNREKYESEGKTVNREEVEEVVNNFFEVLASESGSFALPKVQALMTRLGLTKIKASSREKIDLRAAVQTLPSGQEIELGYSIKSELGGSSSLLNASGHTIFSYRLAKEVNPDYFRDLTTVRELISRINSGDLLAEHLGPSSNQLKENLAFFGDSLWLTLSRALLAYYSGQGKSLQDLLGKLSETDYELRRNYYQVGQFLKAVALGMTPGAEWLGDIDAYGGFILVTKTGRLLALPTTNEDEFRKYLLQNSYLDTPSTTRHKFGKIYQRESEYFVDLSLQVRFY